MKSWFDEVGALAVDTPVVELPARAVDTDSDSDRVSRERLDDKADRSDQVERVERGDGARVSARQSTWIMFGVLTGLVVAATACAVYLFASPDSSSDVSAQSPVQGPAVADPATLVAVAGQCEPNEGETTLSASDDSLRSTVAQWQQAYYERDESLTRLLTDDSWMRDQDWDEVLAQGAPDGTTWCAVMAPVEGNSVDVDVIVNFADESSQTYQQTVVGQPGDDGWLIEEIVTR